jgi:transposase InsO family protein
MPFREVTRMDERRLLAHRVLVEGWSIAASARAGGVSRETAYRWLARAREEGIASLAEKSRRPRNSPGATPPELTQELLALKAEHPFYGARKLSELMQQRVRPRTASRILSRHGLTCPSSPKESMRRFERETSNELWQMDFKGMRMRRPLYEVLSVLDDATRFCIALPALPDQRADTAWDALWTAFEAFGLPDAVLCDNGPAFRNNGIWRPSSLDMRLMKLGIRSMHGRPYHPQTQGKVERFHGTMARELGVTLWQPDFPKGQSVLSAFRDRYNWQRPHEAIQMKVPGELYRRSKRERPERLPKPDYAAGAIVHIVRDPGQIRFKGTYYYLGRALIGESVELLDLDDGWRVNYYGNELGHLEEFRQ